MVTHASPLGWTIIISRAQVGSGSQGRASQSVTAPASESGRRGIEWRISEAKREMGSGKDGTAETPEYLDA